jgi:hypothetical protein
MLTLIVLLVVIAILAWIGRLILAGMGAPLWMLQVGLALVLLLCVIVIANAFGIATPNLR